VYRRLALKGLRQAQADRTVDASLSDATEAFAANFKPAGASGKVTATVDLDQAINSARAHV
jgi:hypothetical protein